MGIESLLERGDITSEVKEVIKEEIRKLKQRNVSLRKERDLVEKYLDIAGVMMIAIDKNQRVTLANKKSCEILGYKEKDILGKNWFNNYLPERLRKNVREVYDKLIAGEVEPVEFYENPIITRIGEERIIAWHNTILKDDEGNIKGTLSSGDDITERKLVEKSLRVSEERYKSLFEGVPIGLYRSTPNGKFDAANPVFLKIFGFEESENLSKIDADELALKIDYPRKKFLERLNEEGEIRGLEVQIRGIDGSKIFIRENTRAIKDDDGSILYYEGSFEDITEKKEIDEQLRKSGELLKKSEEMYQDLYENSPDMYASVDPRTKTIIRCNKTLATNLGYTKEEIIDRPVFNIYHPNCMEDVKKAFQSFAKTGEVHGAKLLLKRKDGRIIDVNLNVSAVRDEEGKILYSRSTLRDITEEKQAQNALRESEERLKAFMDSATDGFVLFDSELVCIDINRAGLKNINSTRKNVLGKTILDIRPDFMGTSRINKLNDVIKSGKALSMDVSPVDSSKILSVRIFKVGEGLGVTSRDITKEKKAEKAKEELERKKDNFVSMTSHELRTPLTVLTGYCDFLIDHFDNITQNRVSNILTIMKSNINRLERLTFEVSMITQIERSLFEIEKAEFDLGQFLKKAIFHYQDALGEQFEFQDNPEALQVVIDGDKNRLQQVLDNVITNAIKNTDKEHRRIIFTSKIHPEKIIINVIDNGAGINSSDLTKIFDQFVSIPTEYSTSGTGIGLYLCSKIMAAHGGTIKAQSEGLGHGATFSINLPRFSKKTLTSFLDVKSE